MNSNVMLENCGKNARENLSQISLIVETCSNNSNCSTNATSDSPVLSSVTDSSHQQLTQISLHEQQQNQQDQGNTENANTDSCTMQCIRFSPFQQQSWHTLCDQTLQEL